MSREDKRLLMTYIISGLWLGFGALGIYFSTKFTELAVYFLSLAAFVGTYVWGESVRKSKETTLFRGGRNSKREVLSYIIILLWAILGTYGVIGKKPLEELAAYFGALTPFVGAYILGQTYKAGDPPIITRTTNETQEQTQEQTEGNNPINEVAKKSSVISDEEKEASNLI